MKNTQITATESIRQRIGEAFAILTKRLGLAKFKIPIPPIRFRPRSGPFDGTEACYDPNSRDMRFTLPCRDGLYTDVVIGEELTHYLHHFARFLVFEARQRLLRRRNSGRRRFSEEDWHSLWLVLNYTESVGLFAGLLVAEELNGSTAVRKLVKSPEFWKVDILLDAAYQPAGRYLPREVARTGFTYGVGYALAILMYEGRRSQPFRLLKKFFWMHPGEFEALADRYDAIPGISPRIKWMKERDARARMRRIRQELQV